MMGCHRLSGIQRRAGGTVAKRRAARAIVTDDEARLVLIKRTKPGQQPYWTTPGGGVEDSDPSIEAALHRELHEELGAEVVGVSQVRSSSLTLII